MGGAVCPVNVGKLTLLMQYCITSVYFIVGTERWYGEVHHTIGKKLSLAGHQREVARHTKSR